VSGLAVRPKGGYSEEKKVEGDDEPERRGIVIPNFSGIISGLQVRVTERCSESPMRGLSNEAEADE